MHKKITTVVQNLSPSHTLSSSPTLPPPKSPFKSLNTLLPSTSHVAPRNNPQKNKNKKNKTLLLPSSPMARSTPILILSLLLLAAVSNACNNNTCALPPRPTPKPAPCAPEPSPAACPRDSLKLGVCVDLLGGLLGNIIGTQASSQCCASLEGLAALDVALCLCTTINANVLGINLDVPIALSAIVSACGMSIPPGFECE